MRFLFIGLPHTITHPEYSGCAFTGHIRRLSAGLIKEGHEVYHFGNPGAELDCTEHINVTTSEYVDRCIGDWKNKDAHINMYADNHPHPDDSKTFHLGVASEIRKRIQKDDYIILNYGTYIGEVIEYLEDLSYLPVFIVESTIGYLDSWRAPYKIFESESVRSWNRSQWNQNWRHYTQENPNFDPNNVPKYAVHECTPQFTDDTINTFVDKNQFEYKEEKQDYFLYLGRLIQSKGINLAVDTCESLGERLIVAGHGNLKDSIGRDIPKNVEFVGHADVDMRRELMSNAKGGWVCTYYSEHGGNVIHEYGISGTPVICTAWGSFTHSVLHNKTGYLIQDGSEAKYAARNIDKIEPWRCRKWQMNYTIERTVPKFIRYFERIKHIWYNGNNPFAEYPVNDLDYREMIHPDDPEYDINLEKINVQNGQSETTESLFDSDENKVQQSDTPF